MLYRLRIVVLMMLILVLAAGCSSNTPDPTPTPEAAAATPTEEPAATVETDTEPTAEAEMEEEATEEPAPEATEEPEAEATEEPAPEATTPAEATVEAVIEEFTSAYPLAATAWQAESFGSPEDNLPLIEDTRASVVYFFDRYAGFDGCSWFLGVYSATPEGELRMMTPARTTNFCEDPPGIFDQAALFTASLLNTTEYRMEGEQLLAFTVEDQQMLTLNPAQPIPEVGTEWELKFWWHADSERWIPVIPLSTSTITFSEGGEASGSGGCNNYTTSYEGELQIEKVMEATEDYAELPALSLGPVASQMVECTEPEGIMDQELNLFTSFTEVAYYFKLGGLMMMLDADGTPLLLFAARS